MSGDANTGRVAMVTADPYRVGHRTRRRPKRRSTAPTFNWCASFRRSASRKNSRKSALVYELLRDPAQRALDRPLPAAPPPPLPKRRSPSYDLTVHPPDLIQLLVDAVAPAMEADFATPKA